MAHPVDAVGQPAVQRRLVTRCKWIIYQQERAGNELWTLTRFERGREVINLTNTPVIREQDQADERTATRLLLERGGVEQRR